MAKRDPSGFARTHALWLIPACGAVLLLGIMLQNPFAVGAGVLGLVWAGRAVWTGR